MINFGYFGFGLLVIAYLLLLTRHKNYFFEVNFFATISYIIHSLIIKDIPVLLINIFIMFVLLYNFYKKYITKEVM